MKEKLIKLIDVLETKQLAAIFKFCMEERNIKKFDGRKKKNNNTYFTYGKDEGWDRVFCIYYDDENIHELEIIFRKRAGLYLVISSGSKILFEHALNGTTFNTFYDEVSFIQMYEKYTPFFNKIFELVEGMK